MRIKTLAAGIATVMLGVGGYWFASPYLALHDMRSAAIDLDADRLNQHIDYDKLRINMKAQFQAKMLGQLSEHGSKSASAAANFGALLGIAMVDKVVDTLVTPQMVMAAMNQAKLGPSEHGGGDDERSQGESKQKECTDWSLSHTGMDRAIVDVESTCDADQGKISLILDRVGFASWRLTDIQLPVSQ